MLIGLVLLTGCAETEMTRISSGQIGCPDNEIKITDEHWGPFTIGGPRWSAVCRGKTFFCSLNGKDVVSCKEALKSGT